MTPIELSGRWILVHTGWLYTRFYENPLFFFDLWSFVHLWTGFVLFAILSSVRSRFKYSRLLLLLLAYEIAEVGFIYSSFHIIRPETFKDQFTDLVVGMAGGYAAAQFLRTLDRMKVAVEEDSRLFDRITALIAAPTVAFLWVGTYGYKYNVAAIDSLGISWWALGLWSLGLFAAQELNSRLKPSVSNTGIRVSLLWMTHVAGLLVVESFGYYLLGIHEVGRPACPSLMFGLVHGTPMLFSFYLTAPFWVLAVQFGLQRLFRGAITTREDLPVSTGPSWSPMDDSRDPERSRSISVPE